MLDDRGPRRRRRIGFAVALVLALTGAVGASGPIEGRVQSLPVPPGQPATGLGGVAAPYDGVRADHYGRRPTGYHLFRPVDGTNEVEIGAAPLPVVIVLHGFNAVDPAPYRAWIEHIVKRGHVVIYPEYQTLRVTPSPETYLPDALTGIRGAISRLRADATLRVALDRVAVVGHSLGGVLAANYAAVATDENLPPAAALMPVEPGGCAGCGAIGDRLGAPFAELARIPAETLALVLVGDADTAVGEFGAIRIWEQTPQIPTDRRDYVTLVSDDRGRPALRADHFQPQTSGFGSVTDALDWYGTWKLFDALADCAFAARHCEIALGNTAAQRFMGFWSDGVPVAPLRVTDNPG